MMKDISAAVAQMGQEEINCLEREQQYELALPKERITLTTDDVEITSEDIPGWSVAREGNITVALDITITEELRQEGIARDLVNRIQNLRKDQGLDVQDKIRVQIKTDDVAVKQAIQAYQGYIGTETQAISLEVLDQLTEGQEVIMDEFQLIIHITVE